MRRRPFANAIFAAMFVLSTGVLAAYYSGGDFVVLISRLWSNALTGAGQANTLAGARAALLGGAEAMEDVPACNALQEEYKTLNIREMHDRTDWYGCYYNYYLPPGDVGKWLECVTPVLERLAATTRRKNAITQDVFRAPCDPGRQPTPPTQVMAPTQLTATSVVGNQLTLRWSPAIGGLAPTRYILEGGIAPGQTLASIPTANAAPILTVTAPTGAFYVRVRAQAGAIVGPPSTEIRVFVDVPTPPSAPGNLQSVSHGTSLSLSWRNTFNGGAPTSVVLDVTGSVTASIPLSLTETASFTGVPSGTYTLAVRALNAAGASGPSNSVTVTLPAAACTGGPSTPINFLAYKVGSTIHLAWEPGPGGGAPTGFVVNVAGPVTGSFPTAARSISGNVGPGSYALNVVATNPCGSSLPTQVQIVTIP